jgi:tripartite-type tricarboxylate transporter receptor subunit TctC
MKRRNFVLASLASASLASIGLPVAAEAEFPSRPIRIIIPATPGGGTDFIGRTLGTHLAEMNGWNMVPDNRPGAGTALGLAEAARAPATGYEIVIGQSDNVSLIPLLMKTAYEPEKDLQPITLAGTTPMVIVVATDSPFKTMSDVIEAAKAKPGEINYGTSGTGGSVHIAVEMLQAEADFKMQHVPYKGSAPALADLVGGHLHVAGSSISSATSLVQAGKIRALGVTSPNRNPALPDVPTIAESGYKDFSFVAYYGVLAPAGVPPEVVKRLNEALVKVLAKPEVKKAFAGQGLEAASSTPEEFAELIRQDIAKAKAIIEKADIKIQ